MPHPRTLGLAFALLALACSDSPTGAVDGGPPDGPPPADSAPLPDGAEWGVDPGRIHDLVAYLAAAESAGRDPGTAGNERALQKVEAIFDELGLEPVGDGGTYRQAFSIEDWQRTSASLSLDGTALVEGTGYRVLSYSGGATVSTNLVFVGYGMTVPAFNASQRPGCPLPATGYDDYAGVDVTGKVVLVLRRGPAENEAIHQNCPANSAAVGTGPALWTVGYKAANARLHGAVGMILVQNYQGDSSIPDISIGSTYHDATFVAFGAERTGIESRVPSLATWAASIDSSLTPSSHVLGTTVSATVVAGMQSVQTANLLGLVRGSDPVLKDQVIVIGGHIDHVGVDEATGEIYYGADDNASGTAVTVELARVLKESGITPKRSILFAAWNAEEMGLLGSCHYVDNPVFPMNQTKYMVSVDMVGAGDGSGLIVYGGSVNATTTMTALVRKAQAADALPYTIQNGGQSFASSSDHYCFTQAGVTAVLALTLGEHAYYHTPQDSIASINSADLEAAARILWATLRPLALGTESSLKPAPAPRATPAQEKAAARMRLRLARDL